MVKVVRDVNLNPLPCSIYLDGFEIPEYEYLKTRAYSDMDSLGIIVGEEGGGKTAYTLQRALFMDHKFNIDNVVFNEKQFLDATENLPKGSAIVWDESDGASEHWASNIVKALKKRLKRCRKNNYTIFLVTPTFFDFVKYFVFHRALFLIDVYVTFDSKSGRIKRGNFRSFNREGMKMLNILGKQYWNMYSWYPDFIGHFVDYPPGFPIDMSDGGEYDLKKDAAMRQNEEDSLTVAEAIIKTRREMLFRLVPYLQEKYSIKMPLRELSRAVGWSHPVLCGDLKFLKTIKDGDSVLDKKKKKGA